MSNKLSSRFPQDIERSIFLLAASEWELWDTVGLLLVAKRVYEWIRPSLFRVFRQVDSVPPRFPDFVKYPSVKLEDVGIFAKHLLIGLFNDGLTEEVRRFLSSCPNVCNLALWIAADSFKVALPLIRDLPLLRLSTSLGSLAPNDVLVPAFSNLTHLDLLDIDNSRWNSDKWNMLTCLPALSHLSIGFPVETDVIHHLLVQCMELQVLIFTLGEGSLWVTTTPPDLFEIGDERLVLMVFNEWPGGVTDWENGANGRVDSWTIAGLFSLARRRKFLNDCSQKWISTSFDLEPELNAKGKEWYTSSGIVGSWEEDPWEDVDSE